MVLRFASFVKSKIKIILPTSDVLALVFSAVLSYFLKFECLTSIFDFLKIDFHFAFLLDIVITLACFYALRIYSRMWQYPVLKDYFDIFLAFIASKLISNILLFRFWSLTYFAWFGIYVIVSGVSIITIRLILRLGYAAWRVSLDNVSGEKPAGRKRVMIIGAGEAGSLILSEFAGNRYRGTHVVVALIDDNKKKHGEYLHGVKVFGGRDKIIETVIEQNVDEIYFAIPSAPAKTTKEILDICKQTDCKLKKLPGIYQFINGQLSATQLKDVEYVDLLGREPIVTDLSVAFEKLKGKTVLVTGGGGSIGSELCRQLSASGVVKKIIIFDIAENGAYNIQQEIKRKYPEQELIVLIGSVRDDKRLDEVFSEHKPDVIYHAAAHKHVPLMETSPKEAVKNNVFGTLNLAQAADRFGSERFVMISTDKAVNPTNIMGATKRVCEMIIQTFNKTSNTEFVAVRFGNVLGSNGSVIPLFKEQIENGGPVTVTHPDIIRYFMLIPEAVALVLKAGATAKGGEIFVLDMGTQVKIAELAENMIRLSGYKPGVDIEIKYTGLREGEKLYEELLIDEEGIQKTDDDLIYIAKPTEIDGEELFDKLSDLDNNMEFFSRTDIIDKVKGIVTTYRANNSEYNTSTVK